MQPTRPGLADCLVVLDILENPAAAKMAGTFALRRIITPKTEHGLVSIMGPGGKFYAKAVGASGVVSAGQNWARLESAARRWALKLAGGRKGIYAIPPGDTISPRPKRDL